jgi:multidrug efflux pump subunit AcrA (membrane-fusion protein)
MNLKKIVIIGICLVLGVLVAVRIFDAVRKAQEKPAVVEQLKPVRVLAVSNRTIEDVLSLTGTVNPEKAVDVVSKLSGRILALHADEGQPVKEGQVLAVIETTELDHSLQNAELAKIAADTSYDNAKLNLDRTQKLFKEGLVAQQQLDAAVLQFTAAETAKKQAENEITQIKSQLASQGWTTKQVTPDGGTIRSSRLVSPLTGVVLKKFSEEGTLVNSQSPVFTVAKTDRVKIRISVEEQMLRYIKVGQAVSLTVNAWPDEFRGVIANILPQVDPATRGITAEIAVANSGGRLLPGMFAKVRLVRQSVNTLALPNRAILEDERGNYIYLLDGDKVVRRDVTVGLSNDDYTAISSGLNLGEKVIVAGQHSVEDGTKVEVVGGAE